MHVGVEEAVPDRVAQEGLDHGPPERRHVVAGLDDGRAVVEADAVDPLARQHVAPGQLPDRLGHPEFRIVLDVLGQFREGGGFEPEIHLHGDGAGERLHHRADAGARPRAQGLDHPGHEAHRLDVAGEPLAHAGPHDLDRDHPLGAVGLAQVRLVDLRDRGGGDRLAERGEQLAERLAEGRFEDADRDLLREGRHPVLQPLQVAGRRHADDVGPRRQELAELDVGRPEAGQRRGQAAGAEARAFELAAEPQDETQMRRQGGFVDEGEAALAGHHPADMDAPREMGDDAQHD